MLCTPVGRFPLDLNANHLQMQGFLPAVDNLLHIAAACYADTTVAQRFPWIQDVHRRVVGIADEVKAA